MILVTCIQKLIDGFLMLGIEMFSMTYFNLVSVVLTKRFRIVCRDIEALAETGDNGNPGSKNNALTQLYFEHNEVRTFS